MAGTVYRALFLVGVVLLTAQLCGCTAYVVGSSGFSVELIHRDSVKSPYHDPSFTAHARVLAAARRSKARAAAIGSPDGAVSELIPRPFEYLMAINVGTPPTRMLAVADTGIDLVWLKCSNGSSSTADHPPSSDAAAAAFDPSSSSTYGLLGCQSGACHALSGSSCDARSNCQYVCSYPDAPQMPGLLSTETFTFDDAPGGGCAGCRDRPQMVVPGVNFGCSSIDTAVPTGFVGLGAGNLSMISQISAATSLGRRFSYCLAPYSVNASSSLNFGSRAAVTEPGAVTTPLRPTPSAAASSFYTIELESVKIGNSTFTLPYRSSNVIVDSGTALTYLDKLLLDPMVEELTRRINLTRTPSPEALLELCFDVAGVTQDQEWALEKVVPDVTLELGGGAVVTLRPENTFVEVEEGVMCLAMAPVTQEQPVAVIGNFAQQNMHVGYDLDKRTITFAPADCASSYPSPPASLAS